jgi:hypothetical protein
MPDKKVYPETSDLEEKLASILKDSTLKQWNMFTVAAKMSEYIGEYEHGSVDIEDLFKEVPLHHRAYMLRATSAVLVDFFETLVHGEEV